MSLRSGFKLFEHLDSGVLLTRKAAWPVAVSTAAPGLRRPAPQANWTAQSRNGPSSLDPCVTSPGQPRHQLHSLVLRKEDAAARRSKPRVLCQSACSLRRPLPLQKDNSRPLTWGRRSNDNANPASPAAGHHANRTRCRADCPGSKPALQDRQTAHPFSLLPQASPGQRDVVPSMQSRSGCDHIQPCGPRDDPPIHAILPLSLPASPSLCIERRSHCELKRPSAHLPSGRPVWLSVAGPTIAFSH